MTHQLLTHGEYCTHSGLLGLATFLLQFFTVSFVISTLWGYFLIYQRFSLIAETWQSCTYHLGRVGRGETTCWIKVMGVYKVTQILGQFNIYYFTRVPVEILTPFIRPSQIWISDWKSRIERESTCVILALDHCVTCCCVPVIQSRSPAQVQTIVRQCNVR